MGYGFDKALCQLAPGLHPSLCVAEFPATQGIAMNKDNQQALLTLHAHLASTYPGAGKAYWAIRAWSLLIWQPCYLAVLSVHSLRQAMHFEGLTQRLEQGAVYGFTLDANSQLNQTGSTGIVQQITRTANALQALVKTLYQQLSEICKVPRKTAMGLVADSLLSALIAWQKNQPKVGNQSLQNFSKLWLGALELNQLSGLMPVSLSDGSERLGLNRSVCCMHYLRDPEDLCATCPKQDIKIRKARIKQTFQEEIS